MPVLCLDVCQLNPSLLNWFIKSFSLSGSQKLKQQPDKLNSTLELEPFNVEWVDPVFVGSDWIKKKYIEFDKNSQRYQTVQIKFVREQLRKLCPSAEDSRELQPNMSDKGVRHPRGIALPALTLARQEFCTAIGAEIDWGRTSS